MNAKIAEMSGFLPKAVGCIVLAGASVASAGEITVDFSKSAGKLKPAIHSSGWAPRSYPRAILNDDPAVSSMNLCYARTHDWALVNSGQRVVDYQYIFPLFDKDVKDPSNYFFAPTDHLLGLSRNLGLKLFYRLGTSIEHTGDIHFNARVPDDFDKVAEIFAATVRHYNHGWANGHEWDIKYWEIWNEPEGTGNWWLPGKENNDPELQEKFIRFFVTCLKRLKTEFGDSIKVGGPALCSVNPPYFKAILKACKEAGVAPDFMSWHYYGCDPDTLERTPWTARKMCDEFGFKDCELIINEYHYLLTWDGVHGRNSTPAMVARALDGPTGINQIDSAAFYLTMLARFQVTPLDQAYWYGCNPVGHWGYMDHRRQFNKPYYAAKLFGGIVRDYENICEVAKASTLTTLAVRSEGRAGLLIADYRGNDRVVTVEVKGLDGYVPAEAVVLDQASDCLPTEVRYRNGRLTLVKPEKTSSAWFVTFEPKKGL